MTEKEQEILDLYLKDLRKKRIIAIFIVICIIIIGLSYVKNFMKNNNQETTLIENTVEENIINEVKNTNDIEKTKENKEEAKSQNEVTNTVNDNNVNQEVKEEPKKESENTR